MVNENKDVKKEEANLESTTSEDTKEQEATVSEDVNTQQSDGIDYQEQYQNALKAMKQEREARRAEEDKAQKLQERLDSMRQSSDDTEEETSFEEEQDKTIALISSDPFAQENLDLVEEKVRQGMDVRQAIDAVKAEILDRINTEGISKEEINKPNLEKPTSASEPVISDTKDRITLKDALAGKVDIDPAQLEAIRNHLPREE